VLTGSMFSIPILVVGDGTLSGLYQQIIKIIREETHKDYITALRANGLKRPTIVRHIFRNTISSILPIIGNRIPLLISGAVIIEVILDINGLSQYIVSGLSKYVLYLRESNFLVFEEISKIFVLLILCVLVVKIMNYIVKELVIHFDPRRQNG